jgi:antitoxin component YwqK of YwqJK toxin-antitoxin module
MKKILILGTMLCLFALHLGAQEFLSSHKNVVDQNGLKQGVWKVYNESGVLKYVGQFRDSKPYGEFTYYYPGMKVKAVSKFSENGDVSRTTLYHDNGFKMAQGKYFRQKKDSVWNYFSGYDADMLIATEYYVDTLKTGVWPKYYADGSIAEEVTYVNDKREGPWRQYFTDGKLKLKATYKNDNLTGLMTVYYPDKTVNVSGTYKNGMKEGVWIFFNEKAEKLRREEFANGHLMFAEKYFDDEGNQLEFPEEY